MPPDRPSAPPALRTARARHRWPLLLLALSVGCSNDSTGLDPDPGAVRAEAFDQFWGRFDSIYPYFVHKGIDWAGPRDVLRDRAATAPTDRALVRVLLDAVAPLRDVHVWFRSPGGSITASFTPDRPPNWRAESWAPFTDVLDYHDAGAWGWGRTGDVGYVQVSGWNRHQVRIEDLDGALTSLRDTRALVVDVRRNGGGDSGLALEFAGRFAEAVTNFGTVRYRTGAAHDSLSPPVQLQLEPRGPWRYPQDVLLLVGPGCFSSNEIFIAAMAELGAVTVAGDTTGGGSGNPTLFDLSVGGRDTGWDYTVPRWILALRDGTVVEWNGIPPDVVVPFDPAAPSDPILEWAFTRAGASPEVVRAPGVARLEVDRDHD